jgi:hypothetical protein
MKAHTNRCMCWFAAFLIFVVTFPPTIGRAQESSLTFFVFFPDKKSAFQEQFEAEIKEVYCHTTLSPGVRLSIRGFANARGSTMENQVLSEQRALSVANRLARYGMSCDRALEIRGLGEEGSNSLDYPFSRRVDLAVSGVLATKEQVNACQVASTLGPLPNPTCKLKNSGPQ